MFFQWDDPHPLDSAHGPGVDLLFVDGHSQFCPFDIMITNMNYYNLDWTTGDLAGQDIKY
jgi:prepilin-type processing-associated H-X9-DG protein